MQRSHGWASRSRSKRVDVGLAFAHAHDALDRRDEDLAVADPPVLAAAPIASTTLSVASAATATSMRIFGRKFTAYSAPR
jgi:hypothetical protein